MIDMLIQCIIVFLLGIFALMIVSAIACVICSLWDKYIFYPRLLRRRAARDRSGE